MTWRQLTAVTMLNAALVVALRAVLSPMQPDHPALLATVIATLLTAIGVQAVRHVTADRRGTARRLSVKSAMRLVRRIFRFPARLLKDSLNTVGRTGVLVDVVMLALSFLGLLITLAGVAGIAGQLGFSTTAVAVTVTVSFALLVAGLKQDFVAWAFCMMILGLAALVAGSAVLADRAGVPWWAGPVTFGAAALTAGLLIRAARRAVQAHNQAVLKLAQTVTEDFLMLVSRGFTSKEINAEMSVRMAEIEGRNGAEHVLAPNSLAPLLMRLEAVRSEIKAQCYKTYDPGQVRRLETELHEASAARDQAQRRVAEVEQALADLIEAVQDESDEL